MGLALSVYKAEASRLLACFFGCFLAISISSQRLAVAPSTAYNKQQDAAPLSRRTEQN
jgi:hypothetical protein